MAWIQIGETDVYYQEDGDKSAQPLLFLHGNSSCSDAWYQQFEHFRDRYRVIAYDSINHGRSSNSPRGIAEPAREDELQGFLEALDIRHPILAGNSMGAGTIIRWAAAHPSEAHALIPSGNGVSATAGAGTTPPQPEPLDLDTLFLPIGDSFTDAWKTSHPVEYQRYLRFRSTATRLEALRYPRPRASYGGPDLAERVKAITSPMLVVVGGLDRLAAIAKNLSTLVPGAEFVEIAGAPHNVYFEAVDAYNAALDDFLGRRVEAAAASTAH
jgi:pimeloyl-ACP methyl ester carboxylesterase